MLRMKLAMGLLGLLLVSPCAHVAAATPSSHDIPSDLKPRCGPNALFVFMLLRGQRDVQLEDLRDIPISSKGTSLLALRDAARRMGVRAQLRNFRPDELDGLPLPAVVHLKGNGDAGTGHFSVVFKLDSTHVRSIDGTTGDVRSIARSTFLSSWTGMALVDEASRSLGGGNTVLCLAAFVQLNAMIFGIIHDLRCNTLSQRHP